MNQSGRLGSQEPDQNLYTLLASRVSGKSDRIFLDQPGFPPRSYGEVLTRASRLLHRLRQRGVEPGDPVIVQVEKSEMAIALYLACLAAGAIFIPLNTAYTRSELAYFLDDAEPRLAVVTPGLHATMAGLVEERGQTGLDVMDAGGEGSLTAGLDTLPAYAETTPVAADDIACILYTSGTTGQPKGAMLTHGNLAAGALSLEAAWEWRDDDVLIHALPIFHVHGLFVALHCAMLGGSKVYFLPGFDAGRIIEKMPSATVLMGVPTFYTRLLDHPGLDRSTCRNMRLFISGSAPLLPETFNEWERRTGHRILERYGMTETNMNLSNPLHGERRPGSVGFPLPGVEARIMGEDGEPVADGEIGSLQVRGPNVFPGYWRKPEKSLEEFTEDGYFITGDLASRDPQSGHYAIVGRAKDLIITGGYNVYPKEVEVVIDDIPGVRESAVIGVPDPDLGEVVTAVVVTSDTDRSPAPDEIIAGAEEHLARYKVPRRVHVVSELPRNAMGKVQKNRLRERFGPSPGDA